MPKPKFTLIADSTQLASFGDCPEQWNLAHIERLEHKDRFKKPMNMGSFGHIWLENYYKFRALGMSQGDALIKCQTIECPVYLNLQAEDIKLIREKLELYVYTYSNNDFIPRDAESVELGFSYPVFEDESRLYILEGKLDHYQHTPALGLYNGQQTIMDHKFQLRARELYAKRLQFRNYALATNTNLMIANYIRLTKKTDDTTFVRKIIPFSNLEHQLWKVRLIDLFRKMEVAIRLNNGDYGKVEPFEHRWSSCEGKYGYPCQFTSICESTSQYELEHNKSTQFVKIEEWKPW